MDDIEQAHRAPQLVHPREAKLMMGRMGGLAGSAKSLALRPLPVRNIGHCRRHLPGQPPAPAEFVSNDVVRHQSKERHQRLGIAA
ncbi:MAG: hypothetical protein ACRD1J_13410, partial [Terriglobia bacterium]